MGWQKWAIVEGFVATILIPSFHTFTLTLLSLLLPLSFLLLAWLSIAQHLLTFNVHPTPSLIILSLFMNTNPPLLHSLVSFISVTALAHVLTGCVLQTPLCLAWAFLCVLQLCVRSGVEATIVTELPPVYTSNGQATWVSRALFFVGLYKTVVVWSRAVIRPVVNDTIYGVMKENSVERVAMVAAFGALWWWRLRTEVEVLGVIVAVKKELLMGVTVYDLFAG